MDEKKSNSIAFVQFPQNFENITKNDVYGASLRVISEVGSFPLSLWEESLFFKFFDVWFYT